MRWLILAGLALVIAGCGGSKSATPTNTSTASHTPTGGIDAALTGFCATSVQWDAHHQPDTKKATGSAYLPFIASPGGGEDQYAAVDQSKGRVGPGGGGLRVV
jgi:hypothetical protein